MYNCSSQLRENKQKLYITYLTSWNNSIFGYKLKQLRQKILKKLRTASLNLEFTGSYKKKCIAIYKHSFFFKPKTANTFLGFTS